MFGYFCFGDVQILPADVIMADIYRFLYTHPHYLLSLRWNGRIGGGRNKLMLAG